MELSDIYKQLTEAEDTVRNLRADIVTYIDQPVNIQDVESAVKTLLMAREAKDAIETQLKLISKAHEALKTSVIPTLFEAHDITSINVSGHRFTVSSKVYASIPDKEAGYKWLRDNELGDIIKETVNASTLSATAKSLIEEGMELDPDLFSVHYKQSTSITKTR